jgi:hypothetical protein
MSWIKSALQLVLITGVTFAAIDVIAYVGFRDQLKTFLPGYGTSIADIDRGYPRYHFQADPELGFDITPGVQTSTSGNPVGLTYDVWGNDFGCFDDPWTDDALSGGIYMAGDSFTWGYVAHPDKFTTLLEQDLGQTVYACGVTHTGQQHQFAKFKRLFDQGIKPGLVVVNIVWNDVNNDAFFPHTTVVEGYMVETVEQCGYHADGNHSFSKLTEAEAEANVREVLEAPRTMRTFLRDYSASANVAFNLIKVLRSTAPSGGSDGEGGAPDTAGECRYWIYGDAYEVLGPDYAQSDLSAPNRQAIADWIAHAKANGYEIIFSLIPARETETPNYPPIRAFIEAEGAAVVDFEDAIAARSLDRVSLYHDVDEHFNAAGNVAYADFLADVISGQR